MGVLWACRTTSRIAIGESPFSLVYGVDAVILVDIGMPYLRTKLTWPNKAMNDQMMTESLDLLEERRSKALIRLAQYYQAAARHYNSKVKECHF